MKLGMEVLTRAEIEVLLDGAFKILGKTGIVVENEEILCRLGEYGGEIVPQKQKVTFKKTFLENFINESQKVDWNDRSVRFDAIAEIYQGYYLDPEDSCFKEWTEQRFLNYIKLAKELQNITGVSMLGCPLKEVPQSLQPLYEKLYCWKYGISGGSAIWTTELCPKIHEMWHLYASETGNDINDVFKGTVYLISPLKFGSVEAEQFMYFYKRGLATKVGMLGSLGGTTPVTLAGALALHLAENLFINILNRVFFGSKALSIGNAVAVLDMSAGIFQYGRPEQSMLNVAGTQIAKFLGADFGGHCGYCDAKVPGNEAGVQKVSSAIFNAMSCGSGHIAAGLLGVDEIFSPIQMILDDEIAGALKRICKGLEVNDETLTLDVIDEIGPGGNFLAADHTALNFRESLWQPAIWSKEMYTAWRDKGMKNDVDKAKEKFFSILYSNATIEPQISEDAEKRLLQIIKR